MNALVFISFRHSLTHSCVVTLEQLASWQRDGSHLQGISGFHCRPSNANTKNNCHIQTGAEIAGWLSMYRYLSGSRFFICCHEKLELYENPTLEVEDQVCQDLTDGIGTK